MFCAGLLLSIADLLTLDWPNNKNTTNATACSARLPACRRNKGDILPCLRRLGFRKAAPPADSCEYHTASGCAFQLTFHQVPLIRLCAGQITRTLTYLVKMQVFPRPRKTPVNEN